MITNDGEKDVPVIRHSVFNVVVTNTEKIRIQRENVRKSDLGPLFSTEKEDEARTEVANLRLQAIASLPHLAVFSDEAHHTYGQSLDTELKKVRKTVDYLHQTSPNLIGVVNTTGTPYFQRQPLRDVVIWYGLSEGIRDGILKPVFDGTLGKRLAKIIPFNHPLTPLDLEEVKRELAARPEETRDVAVVCLGKETAVGTWLEEWNRLRKSGDVPNKIEVIELRSDPKYGGFFQHQPAKARVSIKRLSRKGDPAGRPNDVIRIEIKDFISPAILERLKQQAGVLTPQIDDWRAMVDSVMIDTAYDGETFNIALADVPEKKSDLVAGEYELDAPGERRPWP